MAFPTAVNSPIADAVTPGVGKETTAVATDADTALQTLQRVTGLAQTAVFQRVK
ncbi:hypothetical protein GCM10007385_37690 [Tateyamaria omphalii]|uniref:hypothetical protein n=1 Tax=Tateyamaria omphalii TaxID=299262 RepID=UPI0016735EBB|nr:hypothetical protein [Tateyamaria omphalii]GGX65017.1 hypothetical protein GCM10007385_37690 [Tateyamaria omphalii]